ncbi:MAG: hypothetical protein ACHQM4_05385 [Thermoanaerobaculia bacterium]
MNAAALVLSGVLLQVQALKSNEKPCPYVLVTTSGERIGTLDLPKRDGKPATFRMCANRTLTVFPFADVDWGATEKENSSGPAPTPASGLAPQPTRQSLSGLAKQTPLRDADAAVKQNQTLSGKMKIGGREVSLDDSAPFFGKESVAQYLKLSTFLADTTGCPGTRALAYGTVKNVSRVKLRGLKALVVIGSLRSGDYNGQVQSMDPSDLVPGEESQIMLWLSCDWALKAASTYLMRNETVVVILGDIAGRTEEVARPDGTNPFETPASARAASPARKPTAPSPADSSPSKPR